MPTSTARSCWIERHVAAINKGAGGVPLRSEHGDFSLDTKANHSREAIWDAVCKAASAEVSDGAEVHGLDWWKEHGLATRPFPQSNWYLFPTMVERGLRFELPYQERLARVGAELGRRLHENDMHWWDTQLLEYQALPIWKDFAAPWQAEVVRNGGTLQDYPFWLLTARSMQYAWGANMGIQLMKEVAENVAGHRGVIINASAAAKLGIVSVAVSVLLWMDLRNPYVWACLLVTAGFGLIGFLDDYDKIRKAHHAGLSARMRLALEVTDALELPQEIDRLRVALEAARLALEEQHLADHCGNRGRLERLGDQEGGLRALAWVADKGDDEYRSIAHLRLAGLLLDTKKYEDALKQLDAVDGLHDLDRQIEHRQDLAPARDRRLCLGVHLG